MIARILFVLAVVLLSPASLGYAASPPPPPDPLLQAQLQKLTADNHYQDLLMRRLQNDMRAIMTVDIAKAAWWKRYVSGLKGK